MLDQLNTIKKVSDLKKLSIKELNQIADEIRGYIIDVVSKNGGHLASNLGTVETTIALHAAFDSPKDKLIFDVGHQAYTHKILTSRKEDFKTLRQSGGMSGFPKREESKHDSFDTGHSSTSISAAMGMARARDLKKEDHHVVALIGDGAFTGGMVWEALNDAGHSQEKIIIVLNDNEMSISKNVGAIPKYLSNLRSQKGYIHLKGIVAKTLDAIPLIGTPMRRFLERIKNSIKYVMVPNIIFEQMGFKYFGIIDGHDIEELITIFERAKDIEYPVIIHIQTIKGKGCSFSSERPEAYHSTVPFDKRTGKKVMNGKSKVPRKMTAALIDEAHKDSSICAITAAMEEGCGLDLFKYRFPNRFFDVGIAEQHAVTMAAGLAVAGMKPVFSVYSSFLQRAYDQIIHDVCLPKLPVVFLVYNSGIVGRDGETHQGVFDTSFLRHIPNMTLLAPANLNEGQQMLRYALQNKGPTAICLPGVLPKFGMNNQSIDDPLRWVKYTRAKQKDVAILANGTMLFHAVDAIRLNGIHGQVDVYNARSIKPLDQKKLKDITKKYKKIITIEDNILQGGFGSAVLEWMEREGGGLTPITRLGFDDQFIPHGSKAEIYGQYYLDTDAIRQYLVTILNEQQEKKA